MYPQTIVLNSYMGLNLGLHVGTNTKRSRFLAKYCRVIPGVARIQFPYTQVACSRRGV